MQHDPAWLDHEVGRYATLARDGSPANPFEFIEQTAARLRLDREEVRTLMAAIFKVAARTFAAGSPPPPPGPRHTPVRRTPARGATARKAGARAGRAARRS